MLTAGDAVFAGNRRRKDRRRRTGGVLHDRCERCVEVRRREERDRVAFATGTIDDAMRRREQGAVAPALHHLAEIDHIGSRNRRNLNPVAVTCEDLEAADVVLSEDRLDLAVDSG
jgi:hypothetical protein